MRVAVIVLLLAAVVVSQTARMRQSDGGAETRGRSSCMTSDGLAGVCRREARCPPRRRTLSSTTTRCPGARRRPRICCPFRRQAGDQSQAEQTTKGPEISTGGGFNLGDGTTSGSSQEGSPVEAQQGGGFSRGGHQALKQPALSGSAFSSGSLPLRRGSFDGPSRPGSSGGEFTDGGSFVTGSSSGNSFTNELFDSGSFIKGSSGGGSFAKDSSNGGFVLKGSSSADLGTSDNGSFEKGPSSVGSFVKESSGDGSFVKESSSSGSLEKGSSDNGFFEKGPSSGGSFVKGTSDGGSFLNGSSGGSSFVKGSTGDGSISKGSITSGFFAKGSSSGGFLANGSIKGEPLVNVSSGEGSFGDGSPNGGSFVMRPSISRFPHPEPLLPGTSNGGSLVVGAAAGSSQKGSFIGDSTRLSSSTGPESSTSGSRESFGWGVPSDGQAVSSGSKSSDRGTHSVTPAPGSSSGGVSWGSRFGGGSFVTGGPNVIVPGPVSTSTSPSVGGFSFGDNDSSGQRRPPSRQGSSGGGPSPGGGTLSAGAFSSGGGFADDLLPDGGGISENGFNGGGFPDGGEGDISGGGELPRLGGGTSESVLGRSEDATVTTTPASPVPFGECGRPTPKLVWLRDRRAAPGSETESEDTPTEVLPRLFEIRIIGGKNAEIGKWPWIALIGHKQGDKPPFWFCGGTLIDKQNILTAAHCLKPRAVNPATLVVRLGEYDTNSTSDGASPQDYGVSSFTNHKHFAFPVLHDDISLVHLNKPVVYSDSVKPVCLPDAPIGDYAGTRIEIAGWGYTEFRGEASTVLQEVDLPVVGVQQCQAKYESSRSFQSQFPGGFGDSKLCAGETEGGKDACQGDSGGPMVRLLEDGRYELVGVVSAGVGCGTPDFPGVYTRVSAYLDWIQQNKK